MHWGGYNASASFKQERISTTEENEVVPLGDRANARRQYLKPHTNAFGESKTFKTRPYKYQELKTNGRTTNQNKWV